MMLNVFAFITGVFLSTSVLTMSYMYQTEKKEVTKLVERTENILKKAEQAPKEKELYHKAIEAQALTRQNNYTDLHSKLDEIEKQLVK